MSLVHPTKEIQTDASTSGWGFFFQGKVWSGEWSHPDSLLHINLLEMWAVLHACLTLYSHFAGHAVTFLIDNSSVVAYLKKQGGTKSLQLAELTHRVLQFAFDHDFTIHPLHIAGQLNVIADLASRSGSIVNTEWRMSDQAFRWIQSQSPWGKATIDLFANQLNHQLPLYFSPCPDMAAMAINAMLKPWPEVTLYAFPPTTLMERVLQKIRLEQPKHLLLVAPRLLEAPWYPLLAHLPQLPPIPIPLQVLQLLQPHWHYLHPNPALFNLCLWFIHYPS